MVSGGTVTGDLSSLSSALSNYTSQIDGLSSGWTGPSHDNLSGKAGEFVSEYSGALSSAMESFASACDLYLEYENAKKCYDTSVSNYNKAVANNDNANIGKFQSEMNTYSKQMEEHKKQILSLLSTASSTKLEAASITPNITGGGVAGTDPGASGTAVLSNPDLIQSAQTGYVFPFEKGVDAPVTSSVGNRNAPTAGASTNHKGTDIGVPVGTPIHSLSSGTVLHAGQASGYGQWVQIQQDDGKIVTYGHVSKYDYFSEGDRVNAGDVVALSGNEGVSTGPHLHLQIEDSDGNIYSAEDYFADCWPT